MILEKPCTREGCTGIIRSRVPSALARRKYCSHPCAHEAFKARPGYFRGLSSRGHDALRRKGWKPIARPHERMLMEAGRYEEAARSIYDRGYNTGWNGHAHQHRQLPPKKGQAA